MLRITLHLGKPAEASALNVLGRLDIGVDKLAARADYSGVMRMHGVGVLPPATLTEYPRWSASVWDLVARMTCMCLNRHERVWPETMAEAPGGAFVEDMTALVEEQTCDGETPIRVMVGTAHIFMQSRCRYVATFEDCITGAVGGPMFAHTPKVLNPWDFLTRAYAWCTTGTFVLPPRPGLPLPDESELDDQSVIPIDSLREPARTGITAWLVRHRKAPETHPSISGPCVSAAQLVDFLKGLPKPTRAPAAPGPGSTPKTTEPYRPGKRHTTRATRRKSQGRSRARSLLELAAWSELDCLRHLATLRWGSYRKVVCPHCNSGAVHYWSQAQLRWKCKHCGNRFSVTSKTVFANRRLSLQAIVLAVHMWATGASGMSAMQLQRLMGKVCYNTAFVLMGKLREALVRGFNTGKLEGTVEIDGAHASGKRSREKRGSPMRFNKGKDVAPFDSAMLTSSARSRKKREDKKAGRIDPSTGYPPERRIVMSLRQRSGQHNHGASTTRVGVWTSENPQAVQALIERFVSAPPSVLATDTGTAFPKEIGDRFGRHDQVNHSERFVGPAGQHNNNAESFTTRLDRSESGVHIHREAKYLTDYAVETAFREDHRELFSHADCALQFALTVGLSEDWRGYSQGRRRGHELTALGKTPAATHGYYRKRSPDDLLAWPSGLGA